MEDLQAITLLTIPIKLKTNWSCSRNRTHWNILRMIMKKNSKFLHSNNNLNSKSLRLMLITWKRTSQEKAFQWSLIKIYSTIRTKTTNPTQTMIMKIWMRKMSSWWMSLLHSHNNRIMDKVRVNKLRFKRISHPRIRELSKPYNSRSITSCNSNSKSRLLMSQVA